MLRMTDKTKLARLRRVWQWQEVDHLIWEKMFSKKFFMGFKHDYFYFR